MGIGVCPAGRARGWGEASVALIVEANGAACGYPLKGLHVC